MYLSILPEPNLSLSIRWSVYLWSCFNLLNLSFSDGATNSIPVTSAVGKVFSNTSICSIGYSSTAIFPSEKAFFISAVRIAAKPPCVTGAILKYSPALYFSCIVSKSTCLEPNSPGLDALLLSNGICT